MVVTMTKYLLPPPLQGEPIPAPFIQRVAENEEVRINDEIVNATNPVHLDLSEGEEVQLNTRGRQKGKEKQDAKVPLPSKSKKRKYAGDEDGHKPSRKHKSKSGSYKSGSSSRYWAFALDEEFVKKNYEEYMSDPLGAAVHAILHANDLAEADKAASVLRIQGKLLTPTSNFALLVLILFLSFTPKLQVERDAVLADLERTKNHLKMTIVTMTTLRQSLNALEQVRVNLTREKSEEQEKVRGLEEKIREYV